MPRYPSAADRLGICGTPGVPNRPASQGNAAARALPAKGQSCLPGWATIVQLIPLARPSSHNDSAAAVWSPDLTGSRPVSVVSAAPVTERPWCRLDGPLDGTSNQPETPL